MKAILVENPGKESRLVMDDYETPVPTEDELLVQVHATALNRADLLQRSGNYPVPPGASPILGLEMAGVVEQVGNQVEDWSIGDRVFGLLPGGGYAEYVTIPQEMALPVPENWSFEQAAAIPEVFLTAYQALVWLGELKKKEHVLIHAGASGVGTAAIQLARSIGAQVSVTASLPKHELCLSLGAHHAIDYKNEDFSAKMKALSEGKGVDVIVDFLGASYMAKNMDSLAIDGRLVLLALMGGATVDAFNLAKMFRKRLHIKASTLRSRSKSYKITLTHAFWSDFGSTIENGTIKPVIDSVYYWENASEAHQRMAANKNAGKIILTMER